MRKTHVETGSGNSALGFNHSKQVSRSETNLIRDERGRNKTSSGPPVLDPWARRSTKIKIKFQKSMYCSLQGIWQRDQKAKSNMSNFRFISSFFSENFSKNYHYTKYGMYIYIYIYLNLWFANHQESILPNSHFSGFPNFAAKLESL